MISVAPTMSAAYRYANLCAHRTPLFFFKQKTAYEIMAPNVETSTEARIRKRPSVAVIRSLLALQPVGALHQLLELLFVDRVPRLRRAVLVAVRHHQAVAPEVAALDHRPLDDDADVLAEHLRRYAVRLDMDSLGAVVDVELDGGDSVRGDDEVPTARDDSLAHTASPSCASASGGGASSDFNRSAEIRARSMMNATIRKRMPNAFARSGSQNCFETVPGFDCC